MAGNLILDKYRPIEKERSGGFGSVRIAWDTVLQRKVAIKCIELSAADAARAALPGNAIAPEPIVLPWEDEEEAAARYERTVEAAFSGDDVPEEARWLAHVPGLDEARTAAMLSDANIVAVHDFKVQDSTAYLIMECVEGMTLAEFLRDHDDKITLDIIASVFNDVAHALEIAHAGQVLHLDIKPENILINRHGVAKVADFGLATLADAQGFGHTGGGTIGYMPLEQMRQESLDARCDQWALAAIVYEMLTGENPFRADNLVQAERAIENAELVLPSLCWDDVGVGIDDVMFYALDPDKEERYDSVSEFADELEPFLGDIETGRQELAAIVRGDVSEEIAVEEGKSQQHKMAQETLLQRITPRKKMIAAHIFGAFGSALFAAVSASCIPEASGVGNPVFWIIVAVALALGAIKPHIGAAVSSLAFGVALFFVQAPLAALAVIAATIAWWLFVGRFGSAPANVALSFPLLGAIGIPFLISGFTFAAPLAAGFFLRVRDAVATTAFGAVLAVTLAGMANGSLAGWDVVAVLTNSIDGSQTAGSRMLSLLAQSSVWCAIAAWLIAATLCSALCLRESRVLAVLGIVVAMLVLLAGSCIGSWVTSGQTNPIPELDQVVSIAAGGIVIIATATFAVPKRKTSDEDL